MAGRGQAAPDTVALDSVAPDFETRSDCDVIERARAFEALMGRRRTVRDFSNRPVPREVIERAVMTAASAPSGANQQP